MTTCRPEVELHAEHLADIALHMITAVRDDDPNAVREWLNAAVRPEHLPDLVVVLAAHIPDDVPQRELLAWCTPEWDDAPLPPLPPRGEIRDGIVRRGVAAGMNDQQIEDHFGIPRRTVQRTRRDLRLDTQPRGVAA